MAVITLTVALGVNLSIFTLLDAFLLRPLPFAEPDELVHVWETDPQRGDFDLRTSPPTFADWAARARSVEGLGAFFYRSYVLSDGNRSEPVDVGRVSARLFPLLGVEPLRGRLFAPEEDEKGNHHVALLSERLWERRFGGDPSIVGRTISLDHESYQVVGIMPEEFVFPMKRTEIWLPLGVDPSEHGRDVRALQVVGRLAPGVTRERAEAELTSITRSLAEAHPDALEGHGVAVVPLREALVFFYDTVRLLLLALTAVGVFILVIACSNVASGMLAQAIERSREIGVRVAAGAGRLALARQVLTESALLAAVGVVGGMGLTLLNARFLSAAIPEDLYRVGDFAIGPRAVLVALSLVVVTTLLFGASPILHTWRIRVQDLLAEGNRGGRRHSGRLQRALVIAQVALALALLMGAGLMVQSFVGLQRVDPGFDPSDVLVAELSFPEVHYPDDGAISQAVDRLQRELASIPGVDSVAASGLLPLNFEADTRGFTFAGGKGTDREDEWPRALEMRVSPAYFETLRIPVLRGRGFEATDDSGSRQVAVVNRALAETYGGSGGILGRQIRLAHADGEFTVVGVVGNVKHRNLRQPVGPQIYLSQYQVPTRGLKVLLRTVGEPGRLVGEVRDTIWTFDAGLPLSTRPYTDIVREALALPRLLTVVLIVGSVAALLLAATGVYSLIWHAVNERTREIGVRMAVGARRLDILNLMVGQGTRLAVGGAVLGVLAGLGLSSMLANFLYEVARFDPMTLVLVTVFLVGLAAAASYRPARRAANSDPMTSLRFD